MRYSIHRNRWDNWNGYFGRKKVIEFGLDEWEAKAWLAARKPIIEATWHHWAYNRPSDSPALFEVYDAPQRIEAIETESNMSFIVHYGSGNVRKLLPKRTRSGELLTTWHYWYGSHDRFSRTKIVFRLVNPEYANIDAPVI